MISEKYREYWEEIKKLDRPQGIDYLKANLELISELERIRKIFTGVKKSNLAIISPLERMNKTIAALTKSLEELIDTMKDRCAASGLNKIQWTRDDQTEQDH